MFVKSYNNRFLVLGQNSLKIRTSAYLDTSWQLILSCGIATIRISHLFQLPDIVDLELSVLSVMVNEAY